jgi:hypothetical protein
VNEGSGTVKGGSRSASVSGEANADAGDEAGDVHEAGNEGVKARTQGKLDDGAR